MIKKLFVGSRSNMMRRPFSVSTQATVQELIHEASSHASSLIRGAPLSQDQLEAARSLHDVMRRIPLPALGFEASFMQDPSQASIRGVKLGERKGKNLCYYADIFEDSNLTIGVFCLPAGASL